MIKAVIFDMDGTILNTLEDLTDSINVALNKFGMPLRGIDEVRSFVGNGIHKTIERAVPEGTEEEVIEEVYGFFNPYYRKHCEIKTRPYDGIVDLLHELRAQGYKTAVISNKENGAVIKLVDTVFTDCFDYCLGDTPGIKLKPERDMVDITLNNLGVSVNEAVYVGDSDVDILTARNSDMKCISVTWGFRSRDFLIESGADILADKPADIPELIKNSI